MDPNAGTSAINEERVSRRHLLQRLVARAVNIGSGRQPRPETLQVPYIPYTTRPQEEGP